MGTGCGCGGGGEGDGAKLSVITTLFCPGFDAQPAALWSRGVLSQSRAGLRGRRRRGRNGARPGEIPAEVCQAGENGSQLPRLAAAQFDKTQRRRESHVFDFMYSCS